MDSTNSIPTNKRNGIIDVMRAVAILSVMCAHCIVIMAEPESVFSYYENICNSIGTIGVGIFYFVSGWCFHPKPHSFFKMCLSKLIRIVIPWVLIGIPLWRYCTPSYEGSAVKSLVFFLLGYNSILYYLTNLMIYFVVFYFVGLIRNVTVKRWICIAICLISWGSIVMESFGISPFPTLYLNPFNFALYFSLGFILQSSPEFFARIKKVIDNYFWIIGLLLLFTPLTFSYTENVFTPIFEVLFIIAAYNVGRLFERVKWICKIGQCSLYIYLIHAPIAGYTYLAFTLIPFGYYLQVVRPFLVLAIAFAISFAIVYVIGLLRKRLSHG